MKPTAGLGRPGQIGRLAGLAVERSVPGLFVVLVIAGCVAGPGAASPSAAGTATTAAAASAPVSTAGAEPSPLSATVAPTQSNDPPAPLRAVLTAPIGTTATGHPGSFLIGTAGSDSPWIPGRVLTPLNLAVQAQLRIGFPDDPSMLVSSWTAEVAASADEQGAHPVALGASAAGQAASPEIALTGPGSGDWVMLVDVRFANGDAAAYSWRLVVR